MNSDVLEVIPYLCNTLMTNIPSPCQHTGLRRECAYSATMQIVFGRYELFWGCCAGKSESTRRFADFTLFHSNDLLSHELPESISLFFFLENFIF